jgi:SET domain-containing protein
MMTDLSSKAHPIEFNCFKEDVFCIKVGTKGRGLFATKDIPPRTILHVAPCIRVDRSEYEAYARHTVFEHYLFNDTRDGHKLLALGYGSLFNHNDNPNVDYRVDSDNLCIVYSTGHKAILKNDELCITYGGKLWFDDADHENTELTSEELSDDGIAEYLTRIEVDDN